MHFDTHGELTPGIHFVSLNELTNIWGFSIKRKELIESIIEVAQILKKLGCPILYIDGSFSNNWKEVPGDWDGCFALEGEPNAFLRAIISAEPRFVPLDKSIREQQKERFKCDLFPAWFCENEKETFLEFFQHTRDGKPKGIIAINLRDL